MSNSNENTLAPPSSTAGRSDTFTRDDLKKDNTYVLNDEDETPRTEEASDLDTDRKETETADDGKDKNIDKDSGQSTDAKTKENSQSQESQNPEHSAAEKGDTPETQTDHAGRSTGIERTEQTDSVDENSQNQSDKSGGKDVKEEKSDAKNDGKKDEKEDKSDAKNDETHKQEKKEDTEKSENAKPIEEKPSTADNADHVNVDDNDHKKPGDDHNDNAEIAADKNPSVPDESLNNKPDRSEEPNGARTDVQEGQGHSESATKGKNEPTDADTGDGTIEQQTEVQNASSSTDAEEEIETGEGKEKRELTTVEEEQSNASDDSSANEPKKDSATTQPKPSDEVDSRNENEPIVNSDGEQNHEPVLDQVQNDDDTNEQNNAKESGDSEEGAETNTVSAGTSDGEKSAMDDSASSEQPTGQNDPEPDEAEQDVPIITIEKADTDKSLGKAEADKTPDTSNRDSDDKDPDIHSKIEQHENECDEVRTSVLSEETPADDSNQQEEATTANEERTGTDEDGAENNEVTNDETSSVARKSPDQSTDRRSASPKKSPVQEGEMKIDLPEDDSSNGSPSPRSPSKRQGGPSCHGSSPGTSRSDQALDSMHAHAHNILSSVHTIQKENVRMKEENERLKADKASLQREIKKMMYEYNDSKQEMNQRMRKLEIELDQALERIREFESLVIDRKPRHGHRTEKRYSTPRDMRTPISSTRSSPEVQSGHSSKLSFRGGPDRTTNTAIEDLLRADIKRLEQYNKTIEQTLKQEIEKRNMVQTLLEDVMQTNEAFKAQFEKWRASIQNHDQLKKEHNELSKKYKSIMEANMNMNVALLELQPGQKSLLPITKDKSGSRTDELVERIGAAEVQLRDSKRRVSALEDYLKSLYSGELQILLKPIQPNSEKSNFSLPQIDEKKKRVIDVNGPHSTYASIAKRRNVKK